MIIERRRSLRRRTTARDRLQRGLPHSRPARSDGADGADRDCRTATHLRDPPFYAASRRAAASRRGDDLFAGDRRRRHPAAPPVRLVRSGGRVRRQRRQRSQGAGHQADAVPHQRRLADHPRPDAGGRKRQARDGAGRAEGPLRRSATTSAGRGRWNGPASTSCSASWTSRRTASCRWSCARKANVLRRYVHLGTGNYNPTTGAALHRPRPVHRRRGSSPTTPRPCSTCSPATRRGTPGRSWSSRRATCTAARSS